MFLPRKILEMKLLALLAEDSGQGDITTDLVIPSNSTSNASIIAREAGVIAGIEEISVLLSSSGLRNRSLIADGSTVKAEQRILEIQGDTRTILSIERTALNIMSRMSGIATKTRRLKDELREAKLNTVLACTRKTAPGLGFFDKKAVFLGGGDTHRLHLDDLILIKDNHVAAAGNIGKALRKVKLRASFSKKIEIEVATLQDALGAAKLGVDIILLDNFKPGQIRKTVKTLEKEGLRRRVMLEASGGITSQNLLVFASTGVDIVSLGELTSNTKSLDLSLEILRT